MKDDFVILKRYKAPTNVLEEHGDPVDWFETSLSDCIEHTEWAGYWKQGSVYEMLKAGQTVHTPFALYKRAEEPA